MGRLVHTGLGSSSLVAHVLPYPPPPPCKQVCTRSCSNKHTHNTHLLFLQAHRETEAHFTAAGMSSKEGSSSAHFTAAGMSSQRNQSESFRFKRAAFYQGLKSKVGRAAAKAAALRINLNVQGCSIVASPMNAPSRTSLLLPLLLSHNLPLPRVH
jgi:hypothetical protein